ncbi:hypothetical protein PPRY_a1594 [Pseudoalteromonas prydzensis ACAM 620]|nr:hypothetical protein [Pseudoalteromonas prydzensis ACAM 620]
MSESLAISQKYCTYYSVVGCCANSKNQSIAAFFAFNLKKRKIRAPMRRIYDSVLKKQNRNTHDSHS